MNSIDALNMLDPRYALFGFFLSFANRLQSVGDSFYEEITCKQFFLIACMNLFPKEPPTANDLAKVMGCTRQNVKELLVGLEKKGLVSLVPHNTDKRKRMIVLTDKTLSLLEKYRAKETDFIERLYKGVTEEEIRNVYLILAKLEENLKILNEENMK